MSMQLCDEMSVGEWEGRWQSEKVVGAKAGSGGE